MLCVAAVWALHQSGSLCNGSDRDSSGSEGHGLGSKGDHLVYRAFARSNLQKAAGCPCISRDFEWKVPVLVGTFGCHVLSLSAEFKYSPSQGGKGAGIKGRL